MSAAVQTPTRHATPRSAAAGRRRHDRIPLVADRQLLGVVLSSRSSASSPAPTASTRPARIQAAVIATCPILMAGIGGLWSERAGVVNIGLEGQMILGTWGAAYFTYYYGPWAGHPRRGADGCARRAAARDRDGHLRRRPHRLRCRDQHHRRSVPRSSSPETFFTDLEGGGVKQLTGLDTTADRSRFPGCPTRRRTWPTSTGSWSPTSRPSSRP